MEVEVAKEMYSGECKPGDPVTLHGKVSKITDDGVVVSIESMDKMKTAPKLKVKARRAKSDPMGYLKREMPKEEI